jgi:hypothetical protein
LNYILAPSLIKYFHNSLTLRYSVPQILRNFLLKVFEYLFEIGSFTILEHQEEKVAEVEILKKQEKSLISEDPRETE